MSRPLRGLIAAVSGGLQLLMVTGSLAAPSADNFAGPALPGICVLNRNQVVAQSKVGVSANTQFMKLRNDAQADVNASEGKILADNKALQAQAKTLPPQQLQQRQQALAKRQLDLQNTAAQRNKDLDAVKANALQQISTQAQPIIIQVYRAHKCGVLLSKEAVLAGGADLDISAEIVGLLDKKVTTILVQTTKQQTAKR